MWFFGGSDDGLVDFLKAEIVDIGAVAGVRYVAQRIADKFLKTSMARSVTFSLIDATSMASLIWLTQKGHSAKDFVPQVSGLG